MQTFAKVIQYGDEYPNLFVFSPFGEEEDWSDSVEIDSIVLSEVDGTYFFDDSETKKESKIITKRFILRSENLYNKYKTQKEKYNRQCNSKQAYLTLLKDAFYRGLRGDERGGILRRLYVQMEDGSLRWTYARPQDIAYIKNTADQNDNGLAMTVDFLCPEPYFYELDEGVNFYYNDFDLSFLVFPCDNLPTMVGSLLTQQTKICDQTCEENGLIIRDESQIGYIGELDCFYPECVLDPCQAYLGDIYNLTEDEIIEVCIEGSAGALSPYISFRNEWDTPMATNDANGNYIKYNGVITTGQFIEIDLSSSETGDLEDYTINTNIPGFNINDLEINNFGIFDFEIGINSLNLTGVDGVATFTINWLNKYHN